MKSTLALLALATLPFSACRQKEPGPEAAATPAQAGKVTVLTPAYPVPDTFKASLGKVVDGYACIQTALARDDLSGAKAASSSLHGVLRAMPEAGPDSAARAHWDSAKARILPLMPPMASADSLGAARTHFMDLSAVLLDAIGKFGVSGKEPLYHFHCPMARGEKGADWVQKDSLLANPTTETPCSGAGSWSRSSRGRPNPPAPRNPGSQPPAPGAETPTGTLFDQPGKHAPRPAVMG